MKRTHNTMNSDESETSNKRIKPTILGTPKKIVLLGESSIGKSTFFDKMNNLANSDYQFPKNYNATDNFDFNRIDINTNKGVVTIDLWDTAGQENRGGKLRDAYLKGADGVLLLYDMSNKETIVNISKWLDQVKRIAPTIPIAVIGNKADKFSDLQQTEAVKIRDCNIERDIGHKKFKNFLISIKEDTHLESSSSYWSSNVTVKEEPGCMVGLEYVISTIFKTPLTLI